MGAKKVNRTEVIVGVFVSWQIMMVMLFVIGNPRDILAAARGFGWQKLPAQIIGSDFKQTDDETAQLTVTLQYNIGGNSYETRCTLNGTPENLQHKAELFLKPGETVDCRINPADPSQVMLDEEYFLFGFFFYMSIFLTVFLVLLCIGWCVWIGWRDRPGGMKLSAFLRKLGIIFGCLFVLFFCGIATVRGVREAIQAFGMLGWQRTEATIQTCEITKVRQGPSWDWQTDLAYTYTFDGKEYTGHKWTLFEDEVTTKQKMRQAMRTMTPGDKVICFVNPNDPTQAVLQRRLWSWYGLLLLFWGLAFCAWLLWITLYGKKEIDSNTFVLSYEGDLDALEEAAEESDEQPGQITELPFGLQYELNRRQRLMPHIKLWKGVWPFVILVILALPYILLWHWWVIFLVPVAAWSVKGFFVGLIDVILHPRRAMDIVVDEESLTCRFNDHYRRLRLHSIIRMEKLHPHIWTICFYKGQVIHIPDSVITGRQALHIKLAEQRNEDDE